ncbi:LLM class flavin-dependent oxidoreductase [Amycolatopsis sp. NPDC051903]|uniref:LLM class flavin-dependent oxidoreductase n=1 Tax=Amycolatopsis sp. NPDC051903 TaxID=3363936 RepID=UPI0037A14A4E
MGPGAGAVPGPRPGGGRGADGREAGLSSRGVTRGWPAPRSRWLPPVQRPHPPLYLGGWSKAALRRTADRGDGWLAPSLPVADLRAFIGDLRDRAGRAVPVTVTCTPTDAALIHAYEDLGVDRVALLGPAVHGVEVDVGAVELGLS